LVVQLAVAGGVVSSLPRWNARRSLAVDGACAERLGGSRGPYVLQASIAACHARALRPEDTGWPRIVWLYDELASVSPSPIVDLNRAVAVGMASGPQAGLDALDHLRNEPALRTYHLLPGVRGDLLAKLGRDDEARTEFERAASLTQNARERDILLRRATLSGSRPRA
jgi:predicted RNA polymerase sigma factor